MHKLRRALSKLLPPLTLAGFALLCRTSPRFSEAWTAGVILPVSRLLSGFSARFPFPLLEVGAIALAGWATAALVRALIQLASQRRIRPLMRFGWRMMCAAFALLAGCVLLWYPVYWRAPEEQYFASTEQVQALCQTLIERLNEANLSFSPTQTALQSAVRAAELYLERKLPDGAVKAVRYPEWMSAQGISGLYSPWTGEALVSPLASPAALPFTACHELMHLSGIADEGQANIAAWSACQRLGGEPAVSADLWALRYAMAALMEADSDAWRGCISQMSTALRETFGSMNGFSPPTRSKSQPADVALAAAGLTRSAGNYDALVGWLCGLGERPHGST